MFLLSYNPQQIYNLYILQGICIIKTIKGATYHGN